ncbi:MAG: hypothetical protein J6S01_04220 [Bacteroidales bacterium]|nr:hypothetical protein [Bacteroidales bacterium]
MSIKKYLNLLCVVLLAAAAVLSCEDEYAAKITSFRVSRKVVQISSKGDTALVSYRLVNPYDGEEVKYRINHPERYEIQIDTMRDEFDSVIVVIDTIFANTNRDWLKIEVLEEEAAVAFIASKNQTDTMGREATVTLSYATLPSIDIRVSQTFWVAPVYISDKIVYNNKVVLTVATNDKNYTWSCGLIPKSTFGEGWSDEDIYQYDIARYQEAADAEGKTIEEYLDGIYNIKKSPQRGKNEYIIEGLEPSTEYVVYLYGLNALGSRTSAVYLDGFATLAPGEEPELEDPDSGVGI